MRVPAHAAVLLYFLMPECLCLMIIVNLIDAVTWSVMGFQVIAEPVWKKHRFFLRRKGASAEQGLRKKHHFLISFSPILTLLLKCSTPAPHVGENVTDIVSSSVRKFVHLHPAPFHLYNNWRLRASWQPAEHSYVIQQCNRKRTEAIIFISISLTSAWTYIIHS